MEVLVVLKPLIHSWSQAVQEVEHMIFQDNFFALYILKSSRMHQKFNITFDIQLHIIKPHQCQG